MDEDADAVLVEIVAAILVEDNDIAAMFPIFSSSSFVSILSPFGVDDSGKDGALSNGEEGLPFCFPIRFNRKVLLAIIFLTFSLQADAVIILKSVQYKNCSPSSYLSIGTKITIFGVLYRNLWPKH